jgi:hypothetical protein
MQRVLKVLKKIGVIAVFAILGIFILSVLATYLFEDDIKDIAVAQLNKNLKTKVIIRGEDIELDLLSHFPQASLEFSDFVIKDRLSKTDTLASAKLLSLQFNPLDLINGHYHIKRILLKDALVHVKVNVAGEANYDIWKTSAEQETSSKQKLDLDLKYIRLLRVQLTYDNRQSETGIATNIKDCSFSGSFKEEKYDMETRLDMQLRKLSVDNQSYASNKHIVLKNTLAIDNVANSYRIKETSLAIDKADFNVSGQAIQKRAATDLDFAINAKETSIQTLVALLPYSISKNLLDYESTGRISLDAKVKGLAGKTSSPAIDVAFAIKNANIHHIQKKYELEDVTLNGKYSNGRLHSTKTSLLSLQNIRAKLEGNVFQGYFIINNFSDPSMDVSVQTDMDLAALHEIIALPDIDSLSGRVNLNASFKGRLADLKEYKTVANTKLEGHMQLKNVHVVPAHNGLVYDHLNGYFQTNGNDLLVQEFTGKIKHCDFDLNGEFKNLASFIFLPNQKLQAKAIMKSDLINVGDFIEPANSTQAQKTGTEKAPGVSQDFVFPAFLIFDFSLAAKKVVYGKFSATDVSGNVMLQDKRAELKDVHLNTMEGSVVLNGAIADAGNKKFRTTAQAALKNIDISQCFAELDNFGQNSLTDKQIKGKLNCTLNYTALWNSDLSADMKSIICTADIGIENGQMFNYEPLTEMGKFLKVKSLEHLYFDKLTNNITIRDEKIYIPEMNINSNAMNMTLAGTQTFENIVDYKIHMNISQLMFGKKKEYEDEFGTVKVDDRGGLSLFLIMTGPASDVKIKYDAANSGKNFVKGLKQEKQEIQRILSKNNNAVDASGQPLPKENLNKPQQGFSWEDDNADSKNSAPQPSDSKANPDKSDRKKAFESFKNKLLKKKETQ